MTKSEIEKEYVVDDHGIIKSPGKFEREKLTLWEDSNGFVFCEVD